MSAPAAYSVDVNAAAAHIGSSPSVIRYLIRENFLPAKKLGAKTLIRVTDLEAYFDTLKDA